jgi:hypothetical protein
MGYSTWYTLEIIPEPPEGHPLLEELVDSDVKIDQTINDGWDSKWYDHDVEMVMLSQKYPEFIFSLDGTGEENGDNWITFYKNGFLYMECQPEWYPPKFEDIADKMERYFKEHPATVWVGERMVCEKCLEYLVLSSSGGQTFVGGAVDDNIKEDLVCPKCGYTQEKPSWYPREETK